MKNLLIVALLVIVSASSAKAQVEVKMDTEGPVPIVTVWHPGFTQMCRNLAQKLEAPEGTEAIRFQPKSLPPSRARYLGDVWVASIDRTDKRRSRCLQPSFPKSFTAYVEKWSRPSSPPVAD